MDFEIYFPHLSIKEISELIRNGNLSSEQNWPQRNWGRGDCNFKEFHVGFEIIIQTWQ